MLRTFSLILIELFFSWTSLANEGFWLFPNFEKQEVFKTNQFKVNPNSILNIQNSLIRFQNSCTGSFISSDGLIATTRDCIQSCLDRLPKKNRDVQKLGFYSKNRKDELSCPKMSALHLIEVLDVTTLMREEIKKRPVDNQKIAINEASEFISKKCSEELKDGVCELSSYFDNSSFYMYKYKKIDDLKLVFLSEESIANFGDEMDYFSFPQHSFDLVLLRAYSGEDSYPNNHYLKWSQASAKENESLIVAGFPVEDQRSASLPEIKFLRDKKIPYELESLSELRGLLKGFQRKNNNEEDMVNLQLLKLEKTYSILKAQSELIHSKHFLPQKRADEMEIKKKINESKELQKEYQNLWENLDSTYQELAHNYIPLNKFEVSTLGSQFYLIAKILIQVTDIKTDDQQFLIETLLKDIDFNEDLEIEMLGYSLDRLKRDLKPSHPTVSSILSGKNPWVLAKEMVKKTQLKYLSARKKLITGKSKDILESKDPFIELALNIEKEAQKYRKIYYEKIEPNLLKNQDQLDKLYTHFIDPKRYPRTDSSPRISIGQAKGLEFGDHIVDYQFPIGNLFSFGLNFGFNPGFNPGSKDGFKSGSKFVSNLESKEQPFILTDRWIKKRELLDPNLSMNFLISNDINEGNIGSPVLNSQGEVVGLVLKGNLSAQAHSLGYDPIHSRAIVLKIPTTLEILKKIYSDDRITQEIKRNAQD